MQVAIEGGAEAADEGDRAEACRGTRTRALCAQAGFHRTQEQVQRRALKVGVAFQKPAQPLRRRQDPLPQRQVRQDVIGEMYRRRHPAPGVA